MPSVSVTLPDIEQSVARPVIFMILDQIFDITNLSKETHIYYAGARTSIQTPGTSIDETGERDARFSADRYTFVEVTEKYALDSIQETFVHAFENVPIFEDNALHLSLRPVYASSDVDIQIKYRSNSETEVRRWMADMLIRTARGRDINLHDVKYTYPIPYPLLGLVEDAWKLREAVEGYGEEFKDYFTAHATDRLTILANRAGEYPHLAVTEKQSRIQGLFDFVGWPEAPVRDSDSGSWEIAFNYKFSYQRPDAVFAHYPVSVHNQLMPTKYLESIGTETDPYFNNSYYSKSYEALSLFEAERRGMAVRPPMPFIRLPAFDDFIIKTSAPGSATVISALCFLEDDKQTLMDLKDLGDYSIDSDIMVFLREEAPFMTKLYLSLFHVALYQDEMPVTEGHIEVTPDLVVRALKPLNIRRVYHVRLSMLAEVNMVVQEALNRLSKFPKAFTKVVGSLNELLRLNPDFNLLAEKREISEWELTGVYRILTGGLRANNFGSGGDLPYYGQGNIETWPRRGVESFLSGIDEATIQNYFRVKRRQMLRVETIGIVAHRMNEK